MKNRQGIVGAPEASWTPTPDFELLAKPQSVYTKTFIHKTNRYGKSGSPCLIPLDDLKKTLGRTINEHRI